MCLCCRLLLLSLLIQRLCFYKSWSMNDEEGGDRMLDLRAFVEDGGENCEFESMSE